jgi:hypothetical protein
VAAIRRAGVLSASSYAQESEWLILGEGRQARTAPIAKTLLAAGAAAGSPYGCNSPALTPPEPERFLVWPGVAQHETWTADVYLWKPALYVLGSWNDHG